MTAKRIALIYILAHIVIRLWQLASAGSKDRKAYDEWLLSLDPDDAWEHGHNQGYHGEEGYWPDYPRTEYDDVPDVGRVWHASPEESAYWHGWHVGEEDRERTK